MKKTKQIAPPAPITWMTIAGGVTSGIFFTGFISVILFKIWLVL